MQGFLQLPWRLVQSENLVTFVSQTLFVEKLFHLGHLVDPENLKPP